jgi:PAS domain S-box-containing protein
LAQNEPLVEQSAPVTFDRAQLARSLGATLVSIDPQSLVVLAVEGEPIELDVGTRLGAVLAKETIAAIRSALTGADDPIRARLGPRSVTIQAVGGLLLVRDTTEAEAELARTNRFLDAIIENIPDMIFVKDAETLLFERFNRAGEELLGWSRAELLGKTDHDFYPKEQADFFHAKDRETLRNRVLVDVPEEPILTRGRGLRWLHTKKVPVTDEAGTPLYLLGISEDITARKEADERARALEKELASVIACVPAAVITWAADGRVVAWNPGAEALYGVRSAEAIGSSIERVVPDTEREAFRASVAAVRGGAIDPPRHVYRLAGGAEIEVEEQLFLIRDARGEPSRIGCVARDRSELVRLRRATEVMAAIPGDPSRSTSPVMEGVLETAEMVAADPNAAVLLLGETGVGKSWLARRIHQSSPRVSKPFLEINCASLARELVESELFGHEKGAFTGAQSDKRGLVEAADGGTLFLDEIGELPPAVQAHLLTFLDTQRFRRVGGMRALSANVRVLAATNLDLEKAILEGRFRKDLYYRLSVVPIRIPPLRERRDELRAVAERMLAELAGRRGIRGPVTIDGRAIAALERYDWPGNLRELRNVLERALILNRGGPVRIDHLPVELRKAPDPAPPSPPTLDALELAHIERVLEQQGGNRSRAAEALGISRSTLRRKLAQKS